MSISICLTPAVNLLIKSIFFLLNLFNLFILSINSSHSFNGYNSRQELKTALFITNPFFNLSDNCFFKETGSIILPFSSALHSYVPIKCCIKWLLYSNIKYIYHFLPLFTTLLINYFFSF